VTDLCKFKRGADLAGVTRVNGENTVTCADMTHFCVALPSSQKALQS